ncbi:alpha-amylase family glycosyl hydrolase [Cytophagaceae bacterium ABcell3]|nr:alpha-amylase family glycosyl hydrolase [Cytophagaceae bacterium ABcell3]
MKLPPLSILTRISCIIKVVLFISFFPMVSTGTPFLSLDTENLAVRDSLGEPAWMKDAIIYPITPFNFVQEGKLEDIANRLPELKTLGVNTLLLQPIFHSHTLDQGYDIIDYSKINPELGNKKSLKSLIAKPKHWT